MNLLMGHILYLLVLMAFGLSVPVLLWDPQAEIFLFTIGVLASWRYSWAILNWARFIIYRYAVFPRWRRTADAYAEAAAPTQVFMLVTSFRIGAETTRRVYQSVFQEAIHCGIPCIVVASIVERADQFLIRQIFESLGPPDRVQLSFVRIAGTGKRDAMACGFRAISRYAPQENSITTVIDGDTMLSPGMLRRCAPFFYSMPELGALTTDESCEVEGNWLFREWYNMRFAQRNIYMGSVSLSRRVLTLTGRMSIFRTSLVTDPGFIERVEMDWIDHWRLGRFRFLTGDDKSTWYHLLQSGAEMIYVPDVTVMTVETPPAPGFYRSSVMLMQRWFGNMLRTNQRALKLGPGRIGWFPWLAILDQRLSMWTSLASPVIALLAGTLITPLAIIYYLLWIMISRYIITLSLLVSRPRVSAFYPFLLYYNQVVGALVKTTVLFRPDRQQWTRQKTSLSSGKTASMERRLRWASASMCTLAYSCFLLALASLTGMLPMPTFEFWWHVATGYY